MESNNDLPHELWKHIVGYIVGIPSIDSIVSDDFTEATCRTLANLALVSRQLRDATYTLRRVGRRCIRVVVLKRGYGRFSTANSQNVRLLQLRAHRVFCWSFGFLAPIDWDAHFASFANVVKLDLAHMNAERTCGILDAASTACPRIQALALPTISELLYGTVLRPLSVALPRWHESNGGLRYLSLGQLIGHPQGDRVIDLVSQTCPNIEILECPDGTILEEQWVAGWASFWRSCTNLRASNWPFPISTREDFEQFVTTPKPRLTRLCLTVSNWAWPVVDAVPSVLFGRFASAVPSLRSISLLMRPQGHRQSVDRWICFALVKCSHLESVTVGIAKLDELQTPILSNDIPLVTSIGIHALARCPSVKLIRLDRAFIASAALVEIVQKTPETHTRSRQVEVDVQRFDRDVLLEFLHSLARISSQGLLRVRLSMRVINRDTNINLSNRACDASEVITLIETVQRQHSANGMRVRVALRKPVGAHADEFSGYLVAAIHVRINVGSLNAGVFVNGSIVFSWS